MRFLKTLNTLPCVLSQVVTLNFFVYSTSSLTVTSKNSVDGNFNFEENSEAVFICTISPYNGVLNWYYENTKVAGCIGLDCLDVNTDEGAFKFQYDTTTGIFTWTIASIQMKYNGKVLKCHDGTHYAPFTVTVKEKKGNKLLYLLFLLILSLIPVILLLCLCPKSPCYHCCR